MPAGLNPADLQARLERLRLAQAGRDSAAADTGSTAYSGPLKPPTRGYMSSEAHDRTPPVHRPRQTPQPSLWDRFLFNEGDGYDNTLMGATGLLPPQVAPTGRRSQQAWDELKRASAERRDAFRQREQFPLPSPRGTGQWAAAVLGQAVGAARSPENWIWWSPENLPAALTFDGLMGAGPNLLAQDMQVRAGLRDEVGIGEAVAAGLKSIGLNKIFDGGRAVLDPIWRELAPQLDAAGAGISREFGAVGDPMRNFEVWQYLKDMLQNRPDPYSRPRAGWTQASPRPGFPAAAPSPR